tara:strand:+ start:128 stop:466 length:339 start_codon:yes stop_codon:yes gene_type:complete
VVLLVLVVPDIMLVLTFHGCPLLKVLLESLVVVAEEVHLMVDQMAAVLVDLAVVVLVQVKTVNLVLLEPQVVVLAAAVLMVLQIKEGLDLEELFMLLTPHCNRRIKCQSTLK